MRTLKNILAYVCNFLRILFIGIPVGLIMTKRGRLYLIILSAAAIFLTGLHYYNSREFLAIQSPNQVEKAITREGLGRQVVLRQEEIDWQTADFYASPEEFLKRLEPAGPILISHYVETIYPHGEEDWVAKSIIKIYSGKTSGGEMIYYRENSSKFPVGNYYARTINADSIIVENYAILETAQLIWTLGGLFWAIISLSVLVADNNWG